MLFLTSRANFSYVACMFLFFLYVLVLQGDILFAENI